MIAQLNRAYITSNPSKIWPRLISYFLFEGRPATTKGRWFNPVTFSSLRSAAKGRLLPESDSPIFITGTGRSGSTILGLVLSAHPEAGFLNEPKALWYVANPSDDLIGSYSLNGARYLMDASDATSEISSRARAMYSSFLRMTGSRRIVDKFPEMIFRIDYLNAIFSNPRYIFLYRNPVETICSTVIWSESHRSDAGSEDWWGVNNRKWKLLVEQVVPFDEYLAPHRDLIAGFTSQTDKATVEWIVTMNRGIRMSKQYPAQVLPVKYEDLASAPREVLKKICDFSGLKHDEHFLRFGAETIRPSGNGNKIEIHPALLKALNEISQKLGYEAYSPSIKVTE